MVKPIAARTRSSDRLIPRPTPPDATDPKLIVRLGADPGREDRIVLWGVLPGVIVLFLLLASERSGFTHLTPAWLWEDARATAPCETMANWRVDRLPARCAAFYGVGRR